MGLTSRQAQVARLVLDGVKLGNIAQQLVISEGTVNMHLTEVYGRAQVKGRIQFVRKFEGMRETERAMEELHNLNRQSAELESMFGHKPAQTGRRRKAKLLRAFDRRAFNA